MVKSKNQTNRYEILSKQSKNPVKISDHLFLIFSAYLCTTVSTVLAMITSFLASQHTFCYLQLQAERAKAVKNMNFDEADNDTILAKVYLLII